MSTADWHRVMGKINYNAGALAERGDAYWQLMEAEQLADKLVAAVNHNTAPSGPFAQAIAGPSLVPMPMSPPPTSQPMRRERRNTLVRTASFVDYTPESPCPDRVAPSGGRRRATVESVHSLYLNGGAE